jgi:5'-nucleotidase|tara:strand:+ start:77 stop:973 length:897 start_codon:yes stop_codon:yes gene_type:complete
MNSKLVIGISSRALFDLSQSHKIFEKEGIDAYRSHQIKNENEILDPGEAYNLVTKILKINDLYDSENRVEVILLSRNTADTGLRVFNSIEAHELNITRAVFCGGESPYKYVKAFGVDLFLSSSKDDVKMAIENNVPSARIIPSKAKKKVKDSDLLKIAFDGDSVIFSDESEKVFEEAGLQAFLDNERKKKSMLKAGPFKSFLVELNKLQSELESGDCPIRTALVTARSAPSHKRVIKTLRKWGVRIDESLFLGGMNKADFLKSFEADIFFDDQQQNITDASDKVTSAHVPFGIKNRNQ